MTISLRILGTIAIDSPGHPEVSALAGQSKALALVVYLAIARPRGVHQRDRLANLFWSELDQTHARAALRKTIHRIHHVVGDGFLELHGNETIAITRGALLCDAIHFDDAVRDGLLRIALDAYQTGLLPDFHIKDARDFEEWLNNERAYFHEQAMAVAWKLTQRFVDDRDLTNATHLARKVARLAATDERVLRRVLDMLDTLGDRAGAVEVYTNFRNNLWQKFETTPSRETEQLIAAIRTDQHAKR